MPTYEYKCFACEHTFEQFQSIKAEPIKRCPSCGKLKVRRLLGTGAGLIFKGSGFYITDYRSEGYKKAAKAETGGGESKPAGDSAKSAGGESKPATASSGGSEAKSNKPSDGGSTPPKS
jgi:putative FmdB family regulatory protein